MSTSLAGPKPRVFYLCFYSCICLLCLVVTRNGVCPVVGPLCFIFTALTLLNAVWLMLSWCCTMQENLALADDSSTAPSVRTKLFYFTTLPLSLCEGPMSHADYDACYSKSLQNHARKEGHRHTLIASGSGALIYVCSCVKPLNVPLNGISFA